MTPLCSVFTVYPRCTQPVGSSPIAHRPSLISLSPPHPQKEARLNDLLSEKQVSDDILRDNFGLQEEKNELRRRVADLESELKSRENDSRVADLENDLRTALEQARRLMQEKSESELAHEKAMKEKMEEVDELKKQLEEGNLKDIGITEELTPEQEIVTRKALRKQGKAYREKEKLMLLRIRDLEDSCVESVNIRTAIDEAVHEVVKRANDMQIRLKGENEALKLRIRQLEPEADGDFGEIEDVVRNAIEGSDEDQKKLQEELHRLRETNHVYKSLNVSFEEQALTWREVRRRTIQERWRVRVEVEVGVDAAARKARWLFAKVSSSRVSKARPSWLHHDGAK